MPKKEKEFIRVCLSLDNSSLESLNDLSKKHNMNKSEFVKYLILRYQTTFGYTTPWLRGKS